MKYVMNIVKLIHRVVIALATALHGVGVAALISAARDRSDDAMWHLPYFGVLLCSVWISMAVVLVYQSRRSRHLLKNNIIPAAVMCPCSMGILILGLPSVEYSLLSFCMSLLFTTVPYSVSVATAVSLLWGVAFAAYYHWIGYMQLMVSVIILVSIVVAANIIISKLQQDAVSRDTLLNQARWSAARLPAITMSLEHTIRESERQAASEERSRLAQLLHDSTGYAMTATVVQLNTLRELTRDSGLKERIALLENLVRETNQEIRRQVSELRDNQPSANDIDWQLRWSKLCTVFSDCTGVNVNVDIENMNHHITDDMGEVVYRVIQESLTNAYRHGNATLVSVTAKLEPTLGLVIVKISDNGQGADKPILGNGLRGMMSRVERLQGTVVWDTKPRRGFDVGVDLPLDLGDAYSADKADRSG